MASLSSPGDGLGGWGVGQLAATLWAHPKVPSLGSSLTTLTVGVACWALFHSPTPHPKVPSTLPSALSTQLLSESSWVPCPPWAVLAVSLFRLALQVSGIMPPTRPRPPGLLPGSQIALPALPAAGSEAGLEADRRGLTQTSLEARERHEPGSEGGSTREPSGPIDTSELTMSGSLLCPHPSAPWARQHSMPRVPLHSPWPTIPAPIMPWNASRGQCPSRQRYREYLTLSGTARSTMCTDSTFVYLIYPLKQRLLLTHFTDKLRLRKGEQLARSTQCLTGRAGIETSTPWL